MYEGLTQPVRREFGQKASLALQRIAHAVPGEPSRKARNRQQGRIRVPVGAKEPFPALPMPIGCRTSTAS